MEITKKQGRKKKKGSKMTKKKRTEEKRNGKEKKEKKHDLHMCQVSHRQLLLGTGFCLTAPPSCLISAIKIVLVLREEGR